MSAQFQFYQTYGVFPGTDVAQGTGDGANDWDFKSSGTPGRSAGATEAIRAGDFSFHVYIRGKFSQPESGPQFTSISNIRYYGSEINLTGYGTGAYILASGLSDYTEPTAQSMSGVWPVLPVVQASGIDIGTSDLVAGNPGWTKWVGLQLKTGASSASAGYLGYQYFTLTWDEI